MLETFAETMKEVEMFKRNRLQELFGQCNEDQKEEFIRIYGSPEKIAQRSLVSAIDSVKRMLKNVS